MIKPIAVLGSGPAGLMAAHAAAMRGAPVAVISQPGGDGKALRSRLGGAQFLHEAIPMINDEDEPDTEITYRVEGSVEGYRRKVYGDDPNIPFVSMEGKQDGDTQLAWNLIKTYDALWEQFSISVENNLNRVGPMWVQEAEEKEWFSAIISTIPAPALCRAHAGLDPTYHMFVSQEIKIHNETMRSGIKDTVVYNGSDFASWYRTAVIFGVGSTEYGINVNPPLPTVTARKPIRTNCDCNPNVVRAGRFGTWTKGVLTHEAFAVGWKVADALL